MSEGAGSAVWQQSWFWPVLAVVVGLPIALLVLTEVQSNLVRKRRPSAKLVGLLRTFVVPAAAILILVSQVTFSLDSDDFTWTRIVATVFGFLVILFVLNTVNLALFTNADAGTWRDRLPSIFIDIGRLLLIVIGLAVLFSVVWGTDVGGLFTALGVTSIVIGLALQNAVGSVVSGLLLLFEQPFRLGDWLDTGDVRGRVVEVNWRAVHIDTGNGTQIMPNSMLAGSSFRNLSRAIGYTVTTSVAFTTDDPPAAVVSLLERTADTLPELLKGTRSSAVPLGGSTFELSFDVASPALEAAAMARLRGWLWYAARREGLALDGDATDAFATEDNRAAAIEVVSPVLRLSSEDVASVTPRTSLERYAAGEVIAFSGSVPEALRFVIRGVVGLAVESDEDRLPVGRVESGDYLGQSAITREPMLTTAIALTEVVVLVVPVSAVDALMRAKPPLARELGKVVDRRASEVSLAISAGRTPVSPPRSD